MAYPMRVVRTEQYRLIHNLNSGAPYPLATDIYSSPTFMDIINRTSRGVPTHWFKTLPQYYFRSEWELYDVNSDPEELHNLASDPGHAPVLDQLRKSLALWQEATNDPWRCMPHAVLINNKCFPLHNDGAGR